ncbi:MAG: heavy-metal-associated domain-containing protein [Bacteroidia bacterium]
MTDFKFKTNIKCGGCIAAVTPFLDKVSGVEKWKVDTTIPEKILTVTGDLNNTESIENAVKEAGYTIERIG